MGGQRIDSAPFAKEPEVLLGLWHLGKALGKYPHEILELDPWELGLCMLCYQQADATSAHLLDRMAKSGTPVFPTVVIKG